MSAFQQNLSVADFVHYVGQVCKSFENARGTVVLGQGGDTVLHRRGGSGQKLTEMGFEHVIDFKPEFAL